MLVQTRWLATHPGAILLGECLGNWLIAVPSTHLLHGSHKPASPNSPESCRSSTLWLHLVLLLVGSVECHLTWVCWMSPYKTLVVEMAGMFSRWRCCFWLHSYFAPDRLAVQQDSRRR
eukprot:6213827-Pleurochrysis_carterae.AAC.4